jgi:hypothetical protein
MDGGQRGQHGHGGEEREESATHEEDLRGK